MFYSSSECFSRMSSVSSFAFISFIPSKHTTSFWRYNNVVSTYKQRFLLTGYECCTKVTKFYIYLIPIYFSLKGDRGSFGKNGDKGEPGFFGLKGITGTDGDPGEVGKSIDGDVGEKGKSGAVGEQGFRGEDGFVGLDGLFGRKGETGKRGVQGLLFYFNVYIFFFSSFHFHALTIPPQHFIYLNYWHLFF